MQFFSEDAFHDFGSVQFKYIRVNLQGACFRLTLARSEKRNAFTPMMVREIAFALSYADFSNAIRCIIVDAEGPVFCAGADLRSFHQDLPEVEDIDFPIPSQTIALGDVFRMLRTPCIAQVEGPVLAGGFLIMAGCHMVISVPEATFSLPEVSRGLWPMQVMASLSEILPARKVLEMCMTGRVYKSDEALAMGLVTKIVARDDIRAEVEVLSREIIANAPQAIRTGLEAFRRLQDIPQREQHTFLKEQLDLMLLSDEAKEGAQAFLDKRKPSWTVS